jgi:phage/plasmid-like protein (TIGR03299 family)
VVEKYLLFSTGHDAKTAVQIRFTPVRVVCQNTLIASLEWGTDFSKIYHIPGMESEISRAQEGVLHILKQYNELAALYEQFAGRALTDEQLAGYMNAVFPDPKRRKGQTDHSYDKAASKVRAIRKQAAKLFAEGMGNDVPEIRGTLWAAYNGVVELVDHYLGYSSRWHRLESIWFGEGEHTKQVALAEAKRILATAA